MDIKVGDYVQIKEFNDMIQEFGITRNGGVDCRCTFTKEMIHLCGVVAKVVDIRRGIGVYGYVLTLDFPQEVKGTGWSYSTDMVKQING